MHSQILAMIKRRKEEADNELPAMCSMHRTFSIIPSPDAEIVAVYLDKTTGHILVDRGEMDVSTNPNFANLGLEPHSHMPKPELTESRNRFNDITGYLKSHSQKIL